MNGYKEFSKETQNIIARVNSDKRRTRKIKITQEEMSELLEFTQLLVNHYKECITSFQNAIKDKTEKRKENIKHYKPRFEISMNDYYLIDKIFATNKYHAFSKIVRLENGKTKKRFKAYSIQKLARVFYIAYSVNTRCVIELLQIPDIHFAITSIKKDEFGDLKEYLAKKIAS